MQCFAAPLLHRRSKRRLKLSVLHFIFLIVTVSAPASIAAEAVTCSKCA